MRKSNYLLIDNKNFECWQDRYNNSQVSLKDANAILASAKKAQYPKGIAYAKLNIAASNFLQSKNDIALRNLSEALLWFEANPTERGYPCALNQKGNIYESFGDYENALQFCLKAHKLATEINDRETEAETCSQLGIIFTRLCNFKKALEYYQEGLEIREVMNDENGMASSLNRIGMLKRLIRKYDESLEYYQRSLDIRIKNRQITSIPWTMLGIASTLEEMQKSSEALVHYESGMIGGDIRCTLQCIMGTGRIYSRLGNIAKAEDRLKKSLKMAQALKAPSLVADAFLSIANHYESTGQFEKALKNHKLYQKTKESVQNDEVQSRIRNLEISYAIDKSEQEKEIYRLKHVELKQAYDIIDEKNKDITASINYASRIQRAMLPTPTEIESLNKSSFVLYLPKDIVSGDFYWFKKIGEKLIIVAADCTGHGVPGALMSMLGISFLEEIVNNRGITESGKILDELSKEIQRALHQTNENKESKDGMDISICIIDPSKKTLQYSGAFNNLYLIRNNALFEYRADRIPIGISGFLDERFVTENLKTCHGDKIYMFSDGYADQFGGPNSKKFKYVPLKALLLKIHKLPLLKQKERLEKEFNVWKGTNNQTDDVLVIGLKL